MTANREGPGFEVALSQLEQACAYGRGSVKEARAAVEAAYQEASDGWHRANGVADLAMKHRDAAEAEVKRLTEECTRISANTKEWWEKALARTQELAAAHARISKLEAALGDCKEALMRAERIEHAHETKYLIGGQAMYHALNTARVALAARDTPEET